MTRYFQRDFDGSAYPETEVTEAVHNGECKDWHEVRIVPLDSVVIDGPLPKVKRASDGWYTVDGGVVTVSPTIAARAGERAREYAAIAAAYERDHAIDEAQVKALAEDLAMEWGLTISESEVLAIHLIARGWTNKKENNND